MPVSFIRFVEHKKCSFERRIASALILCALLPALFSAASTAVAAPDIDLRLRIAWGGGASRQWRGAIKVSAGVFSELRLLGLEADEPGSIRLDGGIVVIGQRSPRAYDGLDLLVRAPLAATLSVELTSVDNENATRHVEISLSDIVSGFHNSPLDEQGNRLLIRRAPGDQLRVTVNRHSLVYSPRETLELRLTPHLLGVPPDSSLKRRTQLIRVDQPEGAQQLWEEEEDFHVAADGAAPELGPIQIELPAEEGVYDLVISLSEKRLADRFVPVKPLMLRKVQLVVIDPQPRSPDGARWRQEAQIDPAKPNRWRRLVQHLPGVGKDSVGVDRPPTREYLGRTLVELGPKKWQGYFLPISRPGVPHVFEIEYPNDIPQTLGVSIVERNAAGQVVPIGLDSGVDVPFSPLSGKPALERHRLIFWPRTESPLVLLTNHRDDGPAVFGALRILSGPIELPPARIAAGENGRLLALYFDKPLFPENFSASESLDHWTNRSLDDWVTFYQGGRRLVEYARHVGYNGVVLSAACEGSAIYPSQLLHPTPKYDTGVFFETAQDPQRKDVLEMLFRLFDRHQLKLAPGLQFCSPLPELEWRLLQGGSEATGIELIGEDGASWLASQGARRGMTPYYNPLDQRVQDAMRHVVKELVKRYAHHPSFAGVALQLGPDTYAQLPGVLCGFDDRTIARFAKEQDIAVPGEGQDRFVERAAFFKENEARQTWLKWRAGRLAQLYRGMQQDIADGRQDAKLYLAGADLFTSPDVQQELRPTLPDRTNISEAMLRLGIDAQLYRDDAKVILLRPQRLAPLASLVAQAVNIQAAESSDVDKYFGGDANDSKLNASTGSLFYHEPLSLRLPSFDAVNPFGQENPPIWLLPQVSPAGVHNRRRFIRSLAALDAQHIVDGGWMALLGQEDSLRPFFEVYRQLPAGRFETVAPKTTAAEAAANTPADGRKPAEATPTGSIPQTQPVIVRKRTEGDRTFVYVINDSPWTVAVTLDIDAPYDCPLEPLGVPTPAPLDRQGRKARWRVSLEPYGLTGAILGAADVKIESWNVSFDGAVVAQLHEKVAEILRRVNALRNPPPLPVLVNPGFESSDGPNSLPGWDYAENVTVAADPSQSHSGRQSLRLGADSEVVAWIRSAPFAPPRTGRLAGSVWLKIRDEKHQPPLRLAIEGRRLNGDIYYRFAEVGSLNPRFPLRKDWAWYTFRVDDLPPTGLTELRVGFDLMRKGEVWIDDVQLFDLLFNQDEQNELTKNIALADMHLDYGRVRDCQRSLDGYWPRFLTRYVPLERLAAVPSSGIRVSDQTGPNARKQPPRDEEPSLLNRWRRLPKKIFPF